MKAVFIKVATVTALRQRYQAALSVGRAANPWCFGWLYGGVRGCTAKCQHTAACKRHTEEAGYKEI